MDALHFIPDFLTKIGNCSLAPAPGGRYDNVHRPEGLSGFVEYTLDFRLVLYIGLHRDGLATNMLDGLERAVGVGLAAADDTDVGTLFGHRHRRCAADSPCAAGDDGDFILQAHELSPLLGASGHNRSAVVAATGQSGLSGTEAMLILSLANINNPGSVN